MATTRITIILFLGIFSCVPLVSGVVKDLVLTVYPYVQVGEYAKFSCKSNSADDGDPLFVWSIRPATNRSAIIAGNEIFTQTEYSNLDNDDTTDGKAQSTVEFLVLQSYIGQYLWCAGRERISDLNKNVVDLPGIYHQLTIGSPAPRGGLGQMCNTDGTCNSPEITCVNNNGRLTCECREGFTESGSTCVAKVELGQVCGSSTLCRPANSVCSTNSICQCATGYIASGGECYLQSVPLDQSCAIPGQQCSTVYSVCDSITKICVCTTGYYRLLIPGTTSPQCRQKATVGSGTCTVGVPESCTPNTASCVSPGVCTCTGTAVFNGTHCNVPTNVGLGDSCDDQSATCSVPNSVCRATFPRVCECLTNYYAYLGACLPKGNLQGSCNVGYSSCLDGNAICTNGFCTCQNGFVQQGTICSQVVNVGLGEQCNNSTRVCTVFNSVCTFVSSSFATCQCISGHFESNGNCITGGGIGAICTTSSSCLTPNAECRSDGSQNTCACIQGYQYVSATGTCDLPSLGNPCVQSIGCKQTATGGTTTNPVCSTTTNLCACPTNYYGVNGVQCVFAGQIGDECDPLELASCLTTNAICNSATSPPRCACIDGYTHTVNTGTCDLPSIGEPCRTNVGCRATALDGTMINPQCTGGICSCSNLYYSYDGKCIQKHSLGQTCYVAVSGACSDSLANCTSSGSGITCQCRSPYVNNNGVCMGEAGQFCGPTGEATVTGIAKPASGLDTISTPDVRVEKTCYEVEVLRTETMHCEDSKKSSPLQHGRWEKYVDGGWTDVDQHTESYINGDAANPSVTVSNAQSSYTGQYRCVLCYGVGQTRCTRSEPVQLYVTGTALSSAQVTMSPTSPQKGSDVTFTCNTVPANVATSYKWFLDGRQVNVNTNVYTITNVQPNRDGSYHCEASNTYGTVSSSGNPVALSVQYKPEVVGGNEDIFGNLEINSITIECDVTSNPPVQTYYFYDNNDVLLQGNSQRTFDIDNDLGYGDYYCQAENAVGISERKNFNVQLAATPGVGAATEDSGLSTGTIVAIVLGIIFLLLLILIIIVCCCSYGWCRKKEKVEPQVIEQPVASKPYVIRDEQEDRLYTTNHYVSLPRNKNDLFMDDEEPHYTTVMYTTAPKPHMWNIEPEETYTPEPRYYLKPATNGGPIISMYDDKYSQPRPLQLPALDTQYLYVDDDEPKRRRRRRKKHRHEHRDRSPRQTYYEADPDQDDVENKYAEVLDAKSDDLVVVPGKQNYFE